jgi:hypothetical protein
MHAKEYDAIHYKKYGDIYIYTINGNASVENTSLQNRTLPLKLVVPTIILYWCIKNFTRIIHNARIHEAQLYNKPISLQFKTVL